MCIRDRENGTRIYIASGATGGFDVLRTAALMGKATARFYNEKGPDALKGTPVYEEALQKEQKVVFTGNAVEAIRLFPTKVNVTVAASRASVGPEAMQVTIQSTPGFKGDTQRVEIRNDQVHAVVDVYSATAEKMCIRDSCLVDLDIPAFTPNHNFVSNLVYAANGSCIDTVICDGKILMQDKKVPGEEEIMAVSYTHLVTLTLT